MNEGLTFAHKSFYDLLVAKYFLGKYYRKKDEYMIIASTLSEVAQYNLKIPRDLVIRKLLAELITMNINVKKNNQQAACEKIFVQCRNLIINAPLYLRPKSLLKMCNVDKNEMLKTRSRGYYRQEKKRLLQIMYVVPLVAVVFMIRNVYNMNQYREAARQYYMHVQTGVTKVFLNMDTVFHYNIQIVFLVACVILLVSGVLREMLRKHFSSVAEIILLTWYFTCKEKGIEKEVLKKNFSRDEWKQFERCIIRGSLNT